MNCLTVQLKSLTCCWTFNLLVLGTLNLKSPVIIRKFVHFEMQFGTWWLFLGFILLNLFFKTWDAFQFGLIWQLKSVFHLLHFRRLWESIRLQNKLILEVKSQRFLKLEWIKRTHLLCILSKLRRHIQSFLQLHTELVLQSPGPLSVQIDHVLLVQDWGLRHLHVEVCVNRTETCLMDVRDLQVFAIDRLLFCHVLNWWPLLL